MKTISKYLMALMIITAISLSGCRETKKEQSPQNDHGHSHDEGAAHSHEHEEVKQEEFKVAKDSVKTEEKTHTHDSGEVHQDH